MDYLGVTLSLNKRLANRWSMRGHVTWSDWDWKIGPEYREYDGPDRSRSPTISASPTATTCYFEQSGSNKSNVLVGSRWSFNLNGLYQVAPEPPWGFNLGASLDGREGYISPPYVRAGGSVGPAQRAAHGGHRASSATTTCSSSTRTPTRTSPSARPRLTLSLDGFNLTNQDTVLQVERNSRAGSRTYDVNETLSPRVFRAGRHVPVPVGFPENAAERPVGPPGPPLQSRLHEEARPCRPCAVLAVLVPFRRGSPPDRTVDPPHHARHPAR